MQTFQARAVPSHVKSQLPQQNHHVTQLYVLPHGQLPSHTQ